MQTSNFDYQDADVTLKGFYATPDHVNKAPLILIVHDWSGCNNFAKDKAQQIAALGYIGFAIDMYGDGKTGKTKEEKSALIQPFMQDRNKLKQRILAAFEAGKAIPGVDPSKVAVMGFCFGGLCALDLARSGAAIKGAVSFHGLLGAPALPSQKIQAKVLVLHGYDDPMAGHDQVKAFTEEMTQAKVDWQVHLYGHTLHAFTNPEANDPAFGTVYNAVADHRSWQSMENFWTEIFS